MGKGWAKKFKALITPKYRRDCFDCNWFHARKPHGNRYCQFPGKLQLKVPDNHVIAGNCLCWIKELDPKRRVVSIVEL